MRNLQHDHQEWLGLALRYIPHLPPSHQIFPDFVYRPAYSILFRYSPNYLKAHRSSVLVECVDDSENLLLHSTHGLCWLHIYHHPHFEISSSLPLFSFAFTRNHPNYRWQRGTSQLRAAENSHFELDHRVQFGEHSLDIRSSFDSNTLRLRRLSQTPINHRKMLYSHLRLILKLSVNWRDSYGMSCQQFSNSSTF